MLSVVLLVLLVCMALLVAGTSEGFTPGKAMVIVEPRPHQHLQRVVENFDRLMPADYVMYVFHGRSAGEYARQATAGVGRRCILTPLDTDNLTAAEYNALLTSAAFWQKVDAENILVFQTDTALCRDATLDVGRFEAFDYVGCPYAQPGTGRNSFWGKHAFYGVGGLSFRKKSAMMKCIREGPANGTPEDVFFSDCQDASLPRPGWKDLAALCTQHAHKGASLGAHKIKDLPEADRQTFVSYCPQSAFLV